MTQVRTSGLVKKRILILTASFGEGHNSAARGIRDGLARVAPEGTEVELRDLFAETYPLINELVRKSYLWLVDFAPRFWGSVYRWIDRKKDYNKNFQRFSRLKEHFAALLDRFQPDIIASSFPAYPYLLEQILGPHRLQKHRYRDRLDHRQQDLVSLRRRLLSRSQRTERCGLASSRNRCGQNQSVWFSCKSEICRFHARSTIPFG